MRVLVTGAARGIGRATCLRLARDARAQGRAAKVAAVDLGPSPELDGLVEELRKLGAEALPLHANVGSVDGPARAVGEAIARFGGLDGLVSNAGINRPGLDGGVTGTLLGRRPGLSDRARLRAIDTGRTRC